MKKYAFVIIALAFISQSCNKGSVDTSPAEAPKTHGGGITYGQINGNYRLFDSVYFIGNQALQPLLPEYRHPISRVIPISINAGAYPAASISFDAENYFESGNVVNEFMADDPYFSIQKIWFVKDSIYINYFKREFRNDSSLNITVKGYKL